MKVDTNLEHSLDRKDSISLVLRLRECSKLVKATLEVVTE